MTALRLFANAFLQNILRFLQTQSVVSPLVICSLLPLAVHFAITYALVHLTSLGYKGAPLAAAVALWISLLMLASYVKFGKKFERTWKGLSAESFHYVFTNLKLALPSAAMVCLEYWAFEILVLLSGLMPNSETTTSLTAMCVNTEAIAFMFTYGLSAAVSTRVSNELGARNPEQAKHAMGVAIKLSILQAIVVVLALGRRKPSLVLRRSFEGTETCSKLSGTEPTLYHDAVALAVVIEGLHEYISKPVDKDDGTSKKVMWGSGAGTKSNNEVDVANNLPTVESRCALYLCFAAIIQILNGNFSATETSSMKLRHRMPIEVRAHSSPDSIA
ncbi:hypothetical protein Ancab_004282 [Ancistrocladus abbreviatus]